MKTTILMLMTLATAMVTGCGKKKAESEAEMRARIRREESIRLEERQKLQRERRQKTGPMARPLARKPGESAAPLKVKGPGADAILKAATLADAIKLTKPVMTDEFNKTSRGAMALTIWALKKMTLDAVKALPRTKHETVMKDSEEHRGKVICARVRIVEIRAERSSFGKYHEGAAFVGHGGSKLARFIAVGSTANLNAKSRAKFCGVVIGRYSYKNSGGGSSHSVQLVGMFDLPENRSKGGVSTAAGMSGKGTSKGRTKRRGKPRIRTSRASVSGGLDAATIRRVINRHLSEIKYCYMSVGLAAKLIGVCWSRARRGGVLRRRAVVERGSFKRELS